MGGVSSAPDSPSSSSDDQVCDIADAAGPPLQHMQQHLQLEQQLQQYESADLEFYDANSGDEESAPGPPQLSTLQQQHHRNSSSSNRRDSAWHSTSSLASLPQDAALRVAETAATAAVAAVAAAAQAHEFFTAHAEAFSCCHHKRHRCCSGSSSSNQVCALRTRQKKRRLMLLQQQLTSAGASVAAAGRHKEGRYSEGYSQGVPLGSSCSTGSRISSGSSCSKISSSSQPILSYEAYHSQHQHRQQRSRSSSRLGFSGRDAAASAAAAHRPIAASLGSPAAASPQAPALAAAPAAQFDSPASPTASAATAASAAPASAAAAAPPREAAAAIPGAALQWPESRPFASPKISSPLNVSFQQHEEIQQQKGHDSTSPSPFQSQQDQQQQQQQQRGRLRSQRQKLVLQTLLPLPLQRRCGVLCPSAFASCADALRVREADKNCFCLCKALSKTERERLSCASKRPPCHCSCCGIWMHGLCALAFFTVWGDCRMCVVCSLVLADPTSEVVWLSNLAALKQTVPAAAPTRTPAAAAGEIPETTDAAAAASAAAVDPSAGAAAGQGGRSVQSFDLRSFPRDSPRPPQLRLAAAVVPQTPSTAAAAAGEAAAQTSVAVYVDPTAARGCEAKTLAPATAAATAPLTSSRIQRLQQGPAMCLRVQAVGDVCLVSLPPFVGNNPYTVSVGAEGKTEKTLLVAAAAARPLDPLQLIQAIRNLRTLNPNQGRAYLLDVFAREKRQQLRLQQRIYMYQTRKRHTPMQGICCSSSSSSSRNSSNTMAQETTVPGILHRSATSSLRARVSSFSSTFSAAAAAGAGVAEAAGETAATSEVFSPRLRCLSLAQEGSSERLRLPCRSIWCAHASCFDLESYLYKQFSVLTSKGPPQGVVKGANGSYGEPHKGSSPPATSSENAKAGSWRCPLCKAPALPHELYVCGFVLQLLQQQPKDTASVVFADPDLLLPIPHRRLREVAEAISS
ncbi:MIZ zinc finger protein, putative [Eimeria tenella]|uniref:MIZ zinc finger protein, putative n=1 Tax=Eimeria tenella TaxID=5802 RepID=U6KTP5_EIMTE|nr:MIZ zinc finger protein, putative [Eimeria tenella]CDJ39754.1 MIZ zinc finger protein, putative [Eimeria tenella]|eukprot:XP_013230507.1 MIZ zinc finger protein, putative [Eimeria tenella]